jgi:hypothetical protein
MSPSHSSRKLGSRAGQAVSRLGAGLALAWLAVSSAAIVIDQIHQLPPRRPSPAERAAATPSAQANWRAVYGQLSRRLTYAPPEFGAVWASRSGRICGVVTRLNAGVYYREPFYTDHRVPYFASEDERRFFHTWLDCVGDHWVDLQVASDALGFCAVPRNRTSAIAAVLCRTSAPGRG